MSPRFDSPPPSPNSFSRPRPWPPKSPGRSARIRAYNRRRGYLEKNPGYYNSMEHELADPMLYDALIRRFQSPRERLEVAATQGFARMIQGSLLRGEERLARMARSHQQDRHLEDTNGGTEMEAAARPSHSESSTGYGGGNGAAPLEDAAAESANFFALDIGLGLGERGEKSEEGEGEGKDEDEDTEDITNNMPVPRDREHGQACWEAFLRERFVRGGDDEFDYGAVDENDMYDVLEQQDLEEAWFEDEDPRWASSEESGREGEDGGRGRNNDTSARIGRMRVPKGETGIQDY